MIHVDDEALNKLKDALMKAGQNYKENLVKLTNLIDEITNGDIEGDPANDLLAKFKAKEETLNKITQTIEEAEDYMGLQTRKFDGMINDMKSEMK